LDDPASATDSPKIGSTAPAHNKEAATLKETVAIRKLRAPHPLVCRFANSLVTT
jgi:hypothetical protein